MACDGPVFLGVDVGSGSARCSLVDVKGNCIAYSARPIKTWNPRADYYEQSSENIWRAVSEASRDVLANTEGKVDATQVKGVGFAATCSLVVLDEEGKPLSVNPKQHPDAGDDVPNIIMWMDHRASSESEFINSTQHPVLKYVGGHISIEMETPKLLWLQKHHQNTWNNAAHFFDLCDFLTFRATGSTTRSECSLACKWTYLPNGGDGGEGGGWTASYWEDIGLVEIVEEGYKRVGRPSEVAHIGTAVGAGLTQEAAHALGLEVSTPVSVGIIDAHAGGLGTLGINAKSSTSSLQERMAIIAGTSACHMTVSDSERFVGGVWGPYMSAMIPAMWLHEGGQSACGKLLDFVVNSHPASPQANAAATSAGVSLHAYLGDILTRTFGSNEQMSYLTKDIHVLPFFHGCRSPLADPTLRGIVCGQTLDDSEESLAVLYLAAMQSLAYGTRHILEALSGEGGYDIRALCFTGGLVKNLIYLQQHADVTGCTVLIPKEQEAVAVGSAMLGAVAAGTFTTVSEAMQAMTSVDDEMLPTKTVELQMYHERKYRVYKKMYQDQLDYRNIMMNG